MTTRFYIVRLGLFLAVVLSCQPLFGQATGTHPLARALKIEAVTSKPSRVKGGDWDDKMQQIVLKLKFTNVDTKIALTKLTATVLVFGQSAADRAVMSVLLKENVDVNVPVRQTFEHSCAEVVTRFDRTGVIFGFAYDGWLVVVKDSEGNIVTAKSTSPAHEKNAAKAIELTQEAQFDRNYKVSNYKLR